MQRNSSFHPFSLLAPYPLIQGTFDRRVGSVMSDGETAFNVISRMAAILQVDSAAVKIMKQTHGNMVSYVDEQSPQITLDVDGLLTDKKQLILGTKTADCLPIVFYDPVREIIATCHAGYKGLLTTIIQETLIKLNEQGSQTSDIIVCIGPSICGSCYTVTEERIRRFAHMYPELTDYYTQKENVYYLDLQYIARFILTSHGVETTNIECSQYCTKEHTELFFSRRAEPAGIFLTVIGMI